MDRYFIYKQQVFETTMKLVEVDLIRISAGNISMRLPDGNIAITPSGISYDHMHPEDIVIMDINGKKIEGKYNPSSEKALHHEIYKSKPNTNAVIHTHSRYAIAFSTVTLELPVICLELLFVGGPIPIADYQCPGTIAVGTSAAAIFNDRPDLKGLILKNHGMVAIGESLEAAYQNAYNIETGAEIYHIALQTGKNPVALTETQIKEILAHYNKTK